MKFYKWPLLVLGLASSVAPAYQPSIEIIEQLEDMRLVAFMSQSDVAQGQNWRQRGEAPPLSVTDAIEQVRQFNVEARRDFSSEEIRGIDFREVKGYPNQWHYLIETGQNVDGDVKNAVYVVLMSGKVIPAIIEPESYK